MATDTKNKWINGVLQAITTLALVAITSQVLATKDDVTIIQGQLVTRLEHQKREVQLNKEMLDIWKQFLELKVQIKDNLTKDDFYHLEMEMDKLHLKVDDLARKVAVLEVKGTDSLKPDM